MKRAMICGSFDPVTNGHMNLIARTAALFDEVVVGVFENTEKRYCFTGEARARMLREACRQTGLDTVRVELCSGMVAHYAREHHIDVIVKGARTGADFEYEKMICEANKLVYPQVETLIMPAEPRFGAVSSTMVRELIKYGEDITTLVPQAVCDELKARANKD